MKNIGRLLMVTWLCLFGYNLGAEDGSGEFVKPGQVKATPQATATVEAKASKGSTEQLKASVKRLEKSLSRAGKERQGMVKRLDEANGALDQQADALDALAVAVQGLRENIDKLAAEADKSSGTDSLRARAVEDVRMSLESLGSVVNSLQEDSRRLNQQFSKVNANGEQVRNDTDKQNDLLKLLREDISNNDEDIASLRRQLQKISFEKSKQAGDKQNVDRLRRFISHPLTAVGLAVIALTVSLTR
jgi:chromosome segregation ATPase